MRSPPRCAPLPDRAALPASWRDSDPTKADEAGIGRRLVGYGQQMGDAARLRGWVIEVFAGDFIVAAEASPSVDAATSVSASAKSAAT